MDSEKLADRNKKTQRTAAVLGITGLVLALAGFLLYATSPNYAEAYSRLFWAMALIVLGLVIMLPVFFYGLNVNVQSRIDKKALKVKVKQQLDDEIAAMRAARDAEAATTASAEEQKS